MILAGGAPDSWSIGEAMRQFILCKGVPAEAIRVEGRSLSTHENAIYTRELLGDTAGRKVLLTSDYYMFRVVPTFRKAAVAVQPRPVPDALKQAARWEHRWPAFMGLIETGKIGYYWIRGWI